jgi:hypothetical protein
MVIKSHVKILLKNNTIVEGIVEEWGDNIKLSSLEKDSYIIIQNPKENIVLVKIFIKNKLPQEKIDLEENFQQVVQSPSEDPLRLKSLVELKGLMCKQDKQIISDKLKNHHIESNQLVTYATPNFFKK